MWQNVVVKNFRCLGGIVLNPLGRINLIAGKNNTGKTALLEAIYLHCHPTSCDLPVNINKYRGVADPVQDVADVVGWLFWGKHPAGGLDVFSQDDKGITRTMSMWLLDPVTARERFPEEEKKLLGSFGMAIGDANQPRIVMRYEQPNEPARTSIAVAVATGFHWLPAQIPWSIPSVYLSSAVPATDKDVDFFGELEVAKRQQEILPALQLLEPRLQKLALVPLAGQLVIHGDIGLPRLVPLPFMGEGMRRALSIMLAIANAPGGVVLIDEIENGLHYSVQKDIWKAIAEAARRANAQVFATTHSWECVLHAHEAFSEGDLYDLRMHRLDRLNGEITTVNYEREMIETALVAGLEMR